VMSLDYIDNYEDWEEPRAKRAATRSEALNAQEKDDQNRLHWWHCFLLVPFFMLYFCCSMVGLAGLILFLLICL